MSRYMWVVLCDDIRQEVGNKPSYMGVYTAGLAVPAFPATLAKLCAVIHVRTMANDPFKSLALRILKDDTEMARIEVPAEQLASMQKHVGEKLPEGESEGYFDATFIAQIVPLSLEKPCMLRFRADTEREVLKGGSITVRSQAPS